MRSLTSSLCFLPLILSSVVSQQIWDIWQTTWDRSKLMTRQAVNNQLPINFHSPGPIGQASIVVEDSEVFQDMDGFGASLTDSSAKLLNQLKSQNSNNYWNLMNQLFNPTYSFAGAGLSVVRVPVGASDFSSKVYSWDDTSKDTQLKSFTISGVPSYVWSTIADIKSISPRVKFIAVPWSSPSWMKTSNTMLGGSFDTGSVSEMANYLLKAVQNFQNKGIRLYAIGIQNEPQNSNPTYPSALVSVSAEAQIGIQLRALLDSKGFSDIKIIGYEHNWDDAQGYPVQLIQQAENAFDGVSFHCYAGSVTGQSSFHNAFPSKEIYHTECTGSLGTDWWSNMKWYMDNLFIGGPENWGRTAMMWNLALDNSGNPALPGTKSCGDGCKGVVSISGGSYTLNEEYYAMAQASRAVIPKDSNGPFGQRIGVTVGGQLNSGLRVGAHKTGRARSSDPDRWALVVLNWQDTKNNKWDPQPIEATIEFRNKHANFTFPVGITTLWWFA